VRIVLVGPPGAGKGTQAQFIASHLAIPRISTGDIFRYNVTSNTELGRKAREFMERGDLVPDEVTVAMVRDRLAEDDAQEGFLLDGFPRNVPQAETQEMMTRSPGRNAVTPGPVFSTTPTPSWPRMRPGAQVGTSPLRMCRSVPQIVVLTILTTASVGAAISGIGRSSMAFFPGAW